MIQYYILLNFQNLNLYKFATILLSVIRTDIKKESGALLFFVSDLGRQVYFFFCDLVRAAAVIFGGEFQYDHAV